MTLQSQSCCNTLPFGTSRRQCTCKLLRANMLSRWQHGLVFEWDWIRHWWPESPWELVLLLGFLLSFTLTGIKRSIHYWNQRGYGVFLLLIFVYQLREAFNPTPYLEYIYIHIIITFHTGRPYDKAHFTDRDGETVFWCVCHWTVLLNQVVVCSYPPYLCQDPWSFEHDTNIVLAFVSTAMSQLQALENQYRQGATDFKYKRN